jgi:quercetin dioxygenase-like cupin family protein
VTAPLTGQTHGSDQRGARDVAPPLAVFDLARELEWLASEPPGHDGGRATITLARADRLRVVLTRVRAGRELGAGDTDGALAVLVHDGTVSVTRNGAVERAGPNQLLVIDGGASWRLIADTDAALVLVLAWPAGQHEEPGA